MFQKALDLEPQFQQQPVRQVQLPDRGQHGLVSFTPQHQVIRRKTCRVHHSLGIDPVRQQIRQVSTRDRVCGSGAVRLTFRTSPSVCATVPVDAQATRHDYQPGRELAPSLSGEGTKAAKIVLAEPLEDVGIVVHRPVMVRRVSSRDLEQQPAVLLGERLPRTGSRDVVRRLQQD